MLLLIFTLALILGLALWVALENIIANYFETMPPWTDDLLELTLYHEGGFGRRS